MFLLLNLYLKIVYCNRWKNKIHVLTDYFQKNKTHHEKYIGLTLKQLTYFLQLY